MERAEVVVVGAGAAGLMAAVHAGRQRPGVPVLALDGSPRLGAKILVAGGGRCNVTHHAVDARDFAGSTPSAIRKVLGRFDVEQTVAFFREIGVTLKREETGKLFPTTDKARTVLDALLGAARAAGVVIQNPRRVETVRREGEAFRVEGAWGAVHAPRVVLATGGQSVPSTGSDGHGYAIARSLGHGLTPRIVPALVPLLLPAGHRLTAIRGVSAEATLSVLDARGRTRFETTGAVLLTHFGLSGPAVLDASRWWIDAREEDAGPRLTAAWLPGEPPEAVEGWLSCGGGERVLRRLEQRLPARLALVLLAEAGVDPATTAAHLERGLRRALVRTLTAMDLPVTGPRGWAYAEATAGGIPLGEVHLDRLESRLCPGLYLCGEILDVDGRIGGFNFQWAWSSGYVAGRAAAGAVPP